MKSLYFCSPEIMCALFNLSNFAVAAQKLSFRVSFWVSFCCTPSLPFSCLILWCRVGLSYKPGGFLRSPRLTTYCSNLKFVIRKGKWNDDDDDEIRKTFRLITSRICSGATLVLLWPKAFAPFFTRLFIMRGTTYSNTINLLLTW